MAELPHIQTSASLGDQAYSTVREAIMSGVLQQGEKVTERGLAESLNISPTPVREALRRLEQDRLVTREGPRSVRVTQFGADELLAITMIEDTLRALAARLAAENASAQQIEQMRRALERAEELSDHYNWSEPSDDKVLAVGKALREFHATIDRSSGSSTLIHMLNMVEAFNYDERRRLVLAQIADDPEAVARRFRQHREIFEAIRSRDPEAAERIMREHSRASNDSRIEAKGRPDGRFDAVR
ncbi:GntR family transcriptional regulator [Aeromicrobium sp. YIM 150415]|uniref:GntR family transcriptional regulator n=1 Tax=Aeromicrobium sp. YIM 150415 TaxID=2803912 RepID=UPI001963D1D8|nr:GntR family transcriptional regulator [Aeromicrobium sp. YIM 150415]MBM9461971.1 GntR family transcriptional regulator [Aeromicrobium sp. YIM 150415]